MTEVQHQFSSPEITENTNEGVFRAQIIPILLTVVVFAVLVGVLWLEVVTLNFFTETDILLHVRVVDVVIGGTIYIKTAIDFALYIGNLMEQNRSWKSRIAIEIGTAVGNALGTLAILLIWTFFKEVRWLLALMIFIAALVLFRLAEDGLEHAVVEDARYPRWFKKIVSVLEKGLSRFNKIIAPILRFVIPNVQMKNTKTLPFWPLIGLAFTVPFILGLDDFAGYVPLFDVVNVFGFSIGVFASHMLLNMALYISPRHTIAIVKNPVISFLGSLAFIGLGIWGIIEVIELIGH